MENGILNALHYVIGKTSELPLGIGKEKVKPELNQFKRLVSLQDQIDYIPGY